MSGMVGCFGSKGYKCHILQGVVEGRNHKTSSDFGFFVRQTPQKATVVDDGLGLGWAGGLGAGGAGWLLAPFFHLFWRVV